MDTTQTFSIAFIIAIMTSVYCGVNSTTLSYKMILITCCDILLASCTLSLLTYIYYSVSINPISFALWFAWCTAFISSVVAIKRERINTF